MTLKIKENNVKCELKFAESKKLRIFVVLFREHSSVGLEHLPYKQRVGGSTPSAPTKSLTFFVRLFFFVVDGFEQGTAQFP